MSLRLRDGQTLDAAGLAALQALQIDPAQVECAPSRPGLIGPVRGLAKDR